MYSLTFLGHLRKLAFASAGVGSFLILFPLIAASQEPKNQVVQQPERNSRENVDNSRMANVDKNDNADDGSPALGVIVGSCPGDAVCVRDVIWGSPAEEAGIRSGDYILSIDEQVVTSPIALKRTLQRSPNSDQPVTVKLWRQGETIDKKIELATEGKELPASHQAWLGVMLSPAEDQGVAIEQVVPGSPADEAALRSGDVIARLNGDDVKDVEAFVDRVADLGPGSELQLQIGRNGKERSVSVKLGQVQAAPMRFLREVFRHPMHDMSSDRPGADYQSSSDLTDETLDEMRRDIRSLKEQVRTLQNKSNSGVNRVPDNKSERGDTDSNETSEQSKLQINTQMPTYLAQRYGRRYGNYRNFYRGYRPYFGRRGYGHSYYRYRGRPYYYPGRYRYGRGGGVRIGPNFGVYWY